MGGLGGGAWAGSPMPSSERFLPVDHTSQMLSLARYDLIGYLVEYLVEYHALDEDRAAQGNVRRSMTPTICPAFEHLTWDDLGIRSDRSHG